MSLDSLSERSGGVIGTIGPIGGSGVFSLQERYALTADNYENVSLYLKMNGANGSTTFHDSSLYGHAVTANGDAQISAQSKFGGASAAFDGAGDWLSVPDNESLELGGGDFTIEAWIYLTAFKTSELGFLSATIVGKDNGTSRSFDLSVPGTASSYTGLSLNLWSDDSTVLTGTASHSFSLNTWYHVVACRSGSNLTLYVDGVSKGGGTNATVIQNTSNDLRIGRLGVSGPINFYFPGYIDDLRITKGVARYTGNFTPPQREFRP